MRWLRKVTFRSVEGQRGMSLIETVVALALLALVGVGFLRGLWTTSKSTNIYEQRVTASVLAQSQIEGIKAMAYAPYPNNNYSVVVTPPPGYSLSISVVQIDGTGQVVQSETGKQEIRVAVSSGEKGIFEIKSVKTDWQ